jgi:hypothetical protein
MFAPALEILSLNLTVLLRGVVKRGQCAYKSTAAARILQMITGSEDRISSLSILFSIAEVFRD